MKQAAKKQHQPKQYHARHSGTVVNNDSGGIVLIFTSSHGGGGGRAVHVARAGQRPRLFLGGLARSWLPRLLV